MVIFLFSGIMSQYNIFSYLIVYVDRRIMSEVSHWCFYWSSPYRNFMLFLAICPSHILPTCSFRLIECSNSFLRFFEFSYSHATAVTCLLSPSLHVLSSQNIRTFFIRSVSLVFLLDHRIVEYNFMSSNTCRLLFWFRDLHICRSLFN
jgi:hypothetical protein